MHAGRYPSSVGGLGVSLVTGLCLGLGWVPGRSRYDSRQAESEVGPWNPRG